MCSSIVSSLPFPLILESLLWLWKLSKLHTLHTSKSSGSDRRKQQQKGKNFFERSSRDSISLKRTEQWWRHTFRRIVSNNFFIVFVVFLYLLRSDFIRERNVLVHTEEKRTSPGIIVWNRRRNEFFLEKIFSQHCDLKLREIERR